MLGVGVVGCGYWGPRIVRNLQALESCEVRAVCDVDLGRVERLRRTYPTIRAVAHMDDLLADPGIDAVAICTPVRTHHPLTCQALEAGKHVLVEKPLAHSAKAAEEMVTLAREKDLVLQVDHTFVYSGAVKKLRELVVGGEIGDVLYLDFVRVNLGLFQHDVNVLWDLAPHDLSILTHLVERDPIWVQAVGSTHYGELEDQAYVTIGYEQPLIAHLHVNWLAPVKVRSTLIGGTRRMIVYNDLEPSEKISVYEKGVTINADSANRERALVDYRTGDMFAPYIDKTEPLEAACRSFVAAIQDGTPSPTPGEAGLQVVRILEAAQTSMSAQGERIELASVR